MGSIAVHIHCSFVFVGLFFITVVRQKIPLDINSQCCPLQTSEIPHGDIKNCLFSYGKELMDSGSASGGLLDLMVFGLMRLWKPTPWKDLHSGDFDGFGWTVSIPSIKSLYFGPGK